MESGLSYYSPCTHKSTVSNPMQQEKTLESDQKSSTTDQLAENEEKALEREEENLDQEVSLNPDGSVDHDWSPKKKLGPVGPL